MPFNQKMLFLKIRFSLQKKKNQYFSFKLNFKKKFKTMAAIIALLLALGTITSADQATPELINEYESQIVVTDMDEF